MEMGQSSAGHPWQVSFVTVYRPPNPDAMRLGSARASDVPMLGSTVRVGSEVGEYLVQAMSFKQPANEPNVRKRQATEPIHISEDDSDVSVPCFLVEEATNGVAIPYSIFVIQKLLQCAVGNVKSAKKIRSGAILLEVESKHMATRALAMTNWLETEIKVSAHRSLNSSRGVIRCRDFRECQDERCSTHFGLKESPRSDVSWLKRELHQSQQTLSF